MSCLCEQLAGENADLSTICIGDHWIFKDLSMEEIKALSGDAKRQMKKKGDMLFRQGDPVDEMFLIKSGRIRLEKLFEDGSQITLDIRKAGDFLGESMFSDKGIYPVSAFCIEDSLTCGFTLESFEKKILNYPNIGLHIIRNLSSRIDWLTSQIGSLAVTNIEDRLYRVLTNVAKEHGDKGESGYTIKFPLTHEDLGFLTGAHRVSITRAMKNLRDSGKIVLKNKTMLLTHTKSA